MSRPVVGAAVALLLVVVAACGSDADSGETGEPAPVDASASTSPGDATTSESGGESGDDGATSDPGDPVAAAPTLVPAVTFAIENSDDAQSLAIAPDGSQVAVVTQAELGDPITITLYDSTSGEAVDSTEVVAIGLGFVQWMADGRLVASASRESDPVWLSWDATTLDELPPVALDNNCWNGKVDRNTGVVYSSSGFTGLGEDLCRVDTTDGSVTRSGDGVLVDLAEFWLVPGSGGVSVLHSPDPEGGRELVTLDPDSLAPLSSVSLEQGDLVRAVGSTTWISSFEGRGPDRLYPGAIPVSSDFVGSTSQPDPSDAGTVFNAGNGDDRVFVSAVDGSVIGTIPSGMNPIFFSDWSLDDSVLVTLTIDRQAEIYEF